MLEAAMVLPIILIVLFMIMYLVYYQIWQSVMYMNAQKFSNEIAYLIKFPGYEYILNSEKDYKNIKLAYESDKLYSYISGEYKKDYKNNILDLINNLGAMKFLKSDDMNANVDIESKNTSIIVRTCIKYNLDIPKYFKILGIDNSFRIETRAVSFVDDGSEFIRNADLIYDLNENLLKKFHIDKKIDIFLDRMKDLSGKICSKK